MSDRLAVSACLSVLMMSMFVLFGSDVARVPLGPGQVEAPYSVQTTGMTGHSVQSLVSLR